MNWRIKPKVFQLLLAFILILQCGLNDSFAEYQSKKSKIKIKERDIALTDLIWKIQKMTGYEFVFCPEDIMEFDSLNVEAEGELDIVLASILDDKDLKFTFDNDIYIIAPKPTINIYQQKKKRLIKGIVTDMKKLPLPGVSVVVKGTVKGVSTGIDGNYSIQVEDKPGLKLVFSFIGMKSKEVAITKSNSINVKLEDQTFSMNEVQIRGAYGSVQKREDLVSSSFQVDSKKLKGLPVSRIDMLLDGLVPGMTVSPNSADPSSARPRMKVRLRGEASMAGTNEPLWIIDGVPIYTGDRTNQISGGFSTSVSPLSFIDPMDIETMTVLKDADATSIYGAQGANGVILITTKQAKKGKVSLNANARYGVSKINEQTKFKVLNSKQYLELAKEAFVNSGKSIELFPYQDNDLNQYSKTDTDWYDEFYGIGSNLALNISASGGNDRGNFIVSGGYFKEEGTIKGNTTERFNLRTSNKINLSEKFSIGANIYASYNKNDIFNPGDDYYTNLPIISPYSEDGSFRLINKKVSGKDLSGLNYSLSKFYNNMAVREQNENKQSALSLKSSFDIDYKITDYLSFNSMIALDYNSIMERRYSSGKNWSGGYKLDGSKPVPYSYKNGSFFLGWISINKLNFKKTIGDHKMSALAVFEAKSHERESLGATGYGFLNDNIREITYADENKGTGSYSEKKSLSYVLNMKYSYGRRYYLSVNLRKDGDSRFGKKVKWANFASIGGSWNIHNEGFYNSELVDVLKLKLTLGTSGNSSMDNHHPKGRYSYHESDNYNNSFGASMSDLPNEKLSWETTRMLNTGIRVRLMKRFDFELEAYSYKTSDLLTKMDISRTTGQTRVYRNIGVVTNKGIELSVNSLNINKKLRWTTDFNISHNRNRLEELYNDTEKVMGSTILKPGKDMSTYYLVRWAGVDPADGMPMWYDKDGNITKIYSYDDRIADKSANPIFQGGMTNTFEYKNFSLRIMSTFVYGGYGFSSFERAVSSDGYGIESENQSVNQLDRWQKPGDIASNPKPIWGVSTKSVMNSTRFLRKKTHFKLKNISLNYELDSKWLKKLAIKSCNLSLTVDNVAVWTPYDDKDTNSYKTGMNGYPMQTSFVFGSSIRF
ncbi:MAG: SusC/RagA family TonB-linked outer membrane protein [Marinifilaceae bacterium]|jgi:TonB-linked SusC/RagA family outer membrane protein|nr:SusC/RagA family TonB-linked outer membrane protein [Marinifilaceae bacterium]